MSVRFQEHEPRLAALRAEDERVPAVDDPPATQEKLQSMQKIVDQRGRLPIIYSIMRAADQFRLPTLRGPHLCRVLLADSLLR